MKRRRFIQLGYSGILGVPFAFSGKTPSGIIKFSTMKNPELETPLCQMLGIKYPIIQAGMGGVACPELVAAVSNAGGLGILSGTMVPPDVLREQIRQVRRLTDKPFGVNLLLHNDLFPPSVFEIDPLSVQQIQVVLNGFRQELGIAESDQPPPGIPPLIQPEYDVIMDESVPVFSVGLGNPSREMIETCHNKGMKVMVMVSTLEDALTVVKNGPDMLVAQGNEAGGHRSTWEKKQSKEYAAIGTLPLTETMAEVVDIPVISAGGIVTGKGMMAALMLGAQGVMMGTRFVATRESLAPDFYKRKILSTSSDKTTVTDVFTGMYARVIRNKFTGGYADSNIPVLPPGSQFGITMDVQQAAEQKENPDYYPLYAGQGIDLINEIKSASEVVSEIIQEAEKYWNKK